MGIEFQSGTMQLKPFASFVKRLISHNGIANNDLTKRIPSRFRKELPFLDAFLPDFGMKDTSMTRKLRGSGRTHRSMLFLCELIRHVCESRAIVMFFEDLQWYDSKSLELTHMVLTRLGGAVAMITTRPVENPGRAYLRVYGYGALTSFKLLPLNRRETMTVVLNVLSSEYRG